MLRMQHGDGGRKQNTFLVCYFVVSTLPVAARSLVYGRCKSSIEVLLLTGPDRFAAV